ncbi:MAG TPA: hypothetical protein VFB36_00175 [Nevskiaceae bacterium]|nr:hypothetical protein [Nevskiaceae bacterium]
MKKPFAILAVVAFATGVARADEDKQLKRSDELYVALFGDSMIKADAKHRPPLERASMALDARFGLHPDQHLGYEMRVFYGKLEVSDAARGDGNRSGIGFDVLYRFGDWSLVRPYLLAGVGVAYSDRLPGKDAVAPTANLGFGLTSGTLIELWQRPLRVRAELRYAYEDYRDEYSGSTQFDRSNYLDAHAFLGIEFALTRHVLEPTPPKPEVVPPVQP